MQSRRTVNMKLWTIQQERELQTSEQRGWLNHVFLPMIFSVTGRGILLAPRDPAQQPSELFHGSGILLLFFDRILPNSPVFTLSFCPTVPLCPHWYASQRLCSTMRYVTHTSTALTCAVRPPLMVKVFRKTQRIKTLYGRSKWK